MAKTQPPSAAHADPAALMAGRRAELVRVVEEAGRQLLARAPAAREDPHATTDMDRALDEWLRGALPRVVDAPVFSEERHREAVAEGGLVWIVDPIDGTLNAIVGNPDVAVSAALYDRARRWTVAAAVVAPFHGLSYSAVRGAGAELNGESLTRAPRAHHPAILAVGLPSNAADNADLHAGFLRRFVDEAWILRLTGSAALDVCRVASGQWSGFFEDGLYVWDVAGADLIATETGCATRLSMPDGDLASRIRYLAADSPETLERIAALAARD
jgi:myo-inositol-1(or 4)-monophosphatase